MTITNGYITLQELKARLFPAGTVDSVDDVALERVIGAVSRLIDKYTRRRFYVVSEARYYTRLNSTTCPIDDCVAVTEVKTDDDGDRSYGTTWLATDYDLLPYNAIADGQPYTRLDCAENGSYTFPTYSKGVKVTGSFGYAAAAPDDVKEACVLQSMRLFQRKNAPFGIAGSGEMGQLLTITKLDPDVELLLTNYVRRGLRT